ncbi:MAG: hypothetical protein ACOZCL_01995 [Bacillota bacterium]
MVKKIGWYCPYTVPPLLKLSEVIPVFIPWKDFPSGRIGNVKLCKKATGIIENVYKYHLDGIVLFDCCNIMSMVSELIKTENSDLLIYIMSLPRITGKLLITALLEEWKSIIAFFHQQQRDNDFSIASSADSIEAAHSYHEKSKNIISNIVNKKSVCLEWCTVDSNEILDLEANYNDEKLAQTLSELVLCLRSFYWNHNDAGLIKKAIKNVEQIDDECILQSYINSIITGKEDDVSNELNSS